MSSLPDHFIRLALLMSLVLNAACHPSLNQRGASAIDEKLIWVPVPDAQPVKLGRQVAESPPKFGLPELQHNPCVEYLKRESSSYEPSNNYRRVADISTSANASAIFGTFGLSGHLSGDTHIIVSASVREKVEALDTPEYNACCRREHCGYGYVTEILRGDVEYSSAHAVAAGADASYRVLGVGGNHKFQITDKEQVAGWFALNVKRNPYTNYDRKKRLQIAAAGAYAGAAVGAGLLVGGLIWGQRLESANNATENSTDVLANNRKVGTANSMAIGGAVVLSVLTVVGTTLLISAALTGRKHEKRMSLAPGLLEVKF